MNPESAIHAACNVMAEQEGHCLWPRCDCSKFPAAIRAALAAMPDGRDAALAELQAIVRGFLDCPEIADCAPDDKDPETDDLERRARRALKTQPASGGWNFDMSAAPKGCEPVLAYMPENAEYAQIYVCHQDDDGDWYDSVNLGLPIHVPIVAWMPLPSPPEQ